MSGIDSIVKRTGTPKKTPAQEAKETKDKQDEIVKELVKETPGQPQEKRKPGRPRSNSTDKTSAAAPKSPRSLPDIPLDSAPKTGFQPQQSNLTIAQKIANGIVIQNLSAHCKMFPNVVADNLVGYNPHLHTPEENQSIIDNIKKSARDNAILATLPYALDTTLESAEEMAMYFAVTNPEHSVSPYIMDLQGISGAVLQDPVLGTELKLLQCEIMQMLPENKWARIGLGLFSTISKVITANRKRRQFMMNSVQAPSDAAAYEQF